MNTENKMKFIRGCLKHIICTRNQNEDGEAYRKGVMEPYNEVKEMYDAMVKANSEPSGEQMNSALNNLLISFRNKKVHKDEQIQRIKSLLEESYTQDIMMDSFESIKKSFYS